MDDHGIPSGLINLADGRIGARVISTTDDFFASCENLIKPGRGVFIPDKYTDRGKWMDGWESRRRRGPGHDACILRLGAAGHVAMVDIDTNHFLGNFPPEASVDGCHAEDPTRDDTHWTEILPRVRLQGGRRNVFPVNSPHWWNHVRLNIYPDGGVARFRVWGRVSPDPVALRPGQAMDLASVLHGAAILGCNDDFFSPGINLIMPGRARTMADGWETRRRRIPGHDWLVLAPGYAGRIEEVEVDTACFKGNFPDRCSIDVCAKPSPDPTGPEPQWHPLLRPVALRADHRHIFRKDDLENPGFPAALVRLNIYPDGGISRLRLNGIPVLQDLPNERDEATLIRDLLACCASPAWAKALAEDRPWRDRFDLFHKADTHWQRMPETEWFRAFKAHPALGDRSNLKDKPQAEQEQAGTAGSDPGALQELMVMNQRYQDKFGFVFLLCATGRSGEEMLAAIRSRIDNDQRTELENAANEQAKITRLRLAALFS